MATKKKKKRKRSETRTQFEIRLRAEVGDQLQRMQHALTIERRNVDVLLEEKKALMAVRAAALEHVRLEPMHCRIALKCYEVGGGRDLAIVPFHRTDELANTYRNPVTGAVHDETLLHGRGFALVVGGEIVCTIGDEALSCLRSLLSPGTFSPNA